MNKNHKLYRVLHRITEKRWYGNREIIKDSQIVADTVEFDGPFTMLYLMDDGTKLLSAAFKTHDVIAIVAKAIVQKSDIELSGSISKADKNRFEHTIARALRELGYERDEDGHFIKSIDVEDEG